MSLTEPVDRESSADHIASAIVIECGPAAQNVTALLAANYPVHVRNLSGAMDALVSEIAADVAREYQAGSHAVLPAVLIVASTGDSGRVYALISAMREAEFVSRPRIWPAFVGGAPTELVGFDAKLDESNSGCDVILMLGGAPRPADAAAALGAWLHVKVPAPPSVLAQLPDSEGRVCRYVALGATELRRTETSQPAIDVEFNPTNAATAAASSEIAAAIWAESESLPCIQLARASIRELEAAALASDPSAILRADRSLAEAIAGLRSEMPRVLSEFIAEKVAASIENLGQPGERVHIDAVHHSAQTIQPSDRMAALSELVLLASKGGLSKVFGRAKLTAASAALISAANADIANVIAELSESAQAGVPGQLDAAIDRHRQELASRRDAVVAAATNESQLVWDESLDKARNDTKIWSPIDTDGIRRSWGGPVPPPRRYLIGSKSVAGQLQDSEGTLSVIDLRDDNDRAVLLVAQYGLPLAALK